MLVSKIRSVEWSNQSYCNILILDKNTVMKRIWKVWSQDVIKQFYKMNPMILNYYNDIFHQYKH